MKESAEIPGSDTIKQMDVHLRILDPLLIPAASGDDCSNYISGKKILGAFAGLYLKKNHGQADEKFSELFLQGKVIWSNFYISDDKAAKCIPAPYYIRKIKSSRAELDGRLFSFFDEKGRLVKQCLSEAGTVLPEEEVKKITRLAQEKPLRGKMISRQSDGKTTVFWVF